MVRPQYFVGMKSFSKIPGFGLSFISLTLPSAKARPFPESMIAVFNRSSAPPAALSASERNEAEESEAIGDADGTASAAGSDSSATDDGSTMSGSVRSTSGEAPISSCSGWREDPTSSSAAKAAAGRDPNTRHSVTVRDSSRFLVVVFMGCLETFAIIGYRQAMK